MTNSRAFCPQTRLKKRGPFPRRVYCVKRSRFPCLSQFSAHRDYSADGSGVSFGFGPPTLLGCRCGFFFFPPSVHSPFFREFMRRFPHDRHGGQELTKGFFLSPLPPPSRPGARLDFYTPSGVELTPLFRPSSLGCNTPRSAHSVNMRLFFFFSNPFSVRQYD